MVKAYKILPISPELRKKRVLIREVLVAAVRSHLECIPSPDGKTERVGPVPSDYVAPIKRETGGIGVAHVSFGSSTGQRVVGWVVFVVYSAVLTEVILFKNLGELRFGGLRLRLGSVQRMRMPLSVRIREFSNFIPFKTIAQYARGGQGMGVALLELAGNALAFVPLGFLLPVLLPKMQRGRNVILIAFGVSLSFEVIQLLTDIGKFDVDDVLLNVLGAAVGWLTYRSICRVLHGQAD